MTADYLKDLNPEQLEAATTIDGHLFILAGAGTGKTKTLISRVAYMLDQGVSAENILLITFTNKAARELKDRVESFLGNKAAGFTATTFHSLCANILREYGHLVGLKKSFVVLDETDSRQAMKTTLGRIVENKKKAGVEYDKDELPKTTQLCHLSSKAINSMQDLSGVIRAKNRQLKQPMDEGLALEVINAYYSYLRDNNTIDFDCLMQLCYELLKSHEDVRKSLDARYRYISCDEYQDTNAIQDKILELLTIDYPNLAVVGDDNQSIYSFRCADISNILGFDKRHPNCKRVTLVTNYRSSQEILDLSNAVMKEAVEGIAKELKGTFRGARPVLVETDNTKKEASFIVDEVSKRKYALDQIAVICRSGMQSYILESKLRIAGIPFVKRGGLKFNERAVVKDILAIIRYTCNSADEIALCRVLKHIPGLGDKAIEKLIPYMVIADFDGAVAAAPKKSKEYLRSFCELVDKLILMKLSKMLETLLEDGAYKELMEAEINSGKKNDVNKSEALATLNVGVEDAMALREIATQYDDVWAFISDIAMESTKDDEDSNGKLVITTIHSAKGLEFHTVFLMDCVNGAMPLYHGKDDELNEERRCLYVALTRAKKELFLMRPCRYGFGPSCRPAGVSDFMASDDIAKTYETRYFA